MTHATPSYTVAHVQCRAPGAESTSLTGQGRNHVMSLAYVTNGVPQRKASESALTSRGAPTATASVERRHGGPHPVPPLLLPMLKVILKS